MNPKTTGKEDDYRVFPLTDCAHSHEQEKGHESRCKVSENGVCSANEQAGRRERRRREMNPFVVHIAGTLFHMTRVCPRCRKEQIVPLTKKQTAVRCRFCGADMPPQQDDHARRRTE